MHQNLNFQTSLIWNITWSFGELIVAYNGLPTGVFTAEYSGTVNAEQTKVGGGYVQVMGGPDQYAAVALTWQVSVFDVLDCSMPAPHVKVQVF